MSFARLKLGFVSPALLQRMLVIAIVSFGSIHFTGGDAVATGGLRKTRPPNVVIILVDDLGWNDVGYHGSDISTPHIDGLAAQGLRLERFYVYPTCSPTRATLLTGLSKQHTGVTNRTGLPVRFRLLSEFFRDAGYQTWLCGKWHLGGSNRNEGDEFHPNQRGFDYFYGHLSGAIDYWSHMSGTTGTFDWQRNGMPVHETGYSTSLLTADAVRLVESRDSSRPFLLVLSFNGVHQLLQSPHDPNVTARHVDRESRAVYRDMVESVDAGIGQVLSAISARKEEASTLVLFLSDNGGKEGYAASNKPLRGGKGQLFDGGIRVPAIMKWPGVLPGGVASEQLTWAADVLPTLMSAAGISKVSQPRTDGTDLWRALTNGQVVERDGFVLSLGRRGWAYVTEEWKLVRASETSSVQLFQIVADPGETTNLVETRPAIVRKLVDQVRIHLPNVATRIQRPSGAKSDALLVAGMAVALATLSAVLAIAVFSKRRLLRL